MKIKYYLLLLFFSLAIHNVHAAVVHAIIVTDTAGDIKAITQPDLKRIRSELKIIAKHTRLALKEKVFSGRHFKSHELVKYITELKVNRQDVIVFYFSGHGYRHKELSSPLPIMSFELYKKGVALHWIVDQIKSKNSRFALILADCCNNYAEQIYQAQNKNISINLRLVKPVYPGYKQLFLNTRGCLVACSSSKGQFSYGSKEGGLYTQCFLASLNRELSNPTPSWTEIMNRADSYISHIQKPVCEFYAF